MSAGIGLSAVQEAVYSRLTGDVTLMALVTGVFDTAPNAQAFPYIDVGDGEETPFRTFGGKGHETFVTVRIYTQDEANGKRGFKEGLVIADRVTVLLDGHSLVVADHSTVLCNLEDVLKHREDDGVTRQVAATFRVIVQ